MRTSLIFVFILLSIASFSQKKKKKNQGNKVFETDTIHTIDIILPQCNAIDSLYFYKDSVLENIYVQANIYINGKLHPMCGLRFKGESSYDFYPGKKKSLKIDFNKFVKGQKWNGLTKINLNNGFKDPSMMREKLYLDFMQKIGLPAPRCTYASVSINNEDYGLYFVVEQPDKKFLKKHFGNKDGEYYKGEPKASFEYLGNKPEDYTSSFLPRHDSEVIAQGLVDLITIINDSTLTPDEFIAKLDSKFNAYDCLRTWAVNTVFCNTDAYNTFYPHNFYIYQNTETGKFEWVSYDANYSFCAWSPALTYKNAVNLSVLYIHKGGKSRPLQKMLFDNETYRNYYLDYVDKIVNELYTPEMLKQQTDSIARKIRPALYFDSAKMYSNNDFEKNTNKTIGDPLDPGNFIPGINEFYAQRVKFIKKELKRLR